MVLRYTPDGNVLLSPVGNRVNAVDLVQGRQVASGRLFPLEPGGAGFSQPHDS